MILPTKSELYKALRTMGPKLLRKDLQDDWTYENPTRNYCYVIAEFVYWYLAPKGSTAMELKLPGETAPHRFVKDPDGAIIDLARWQFDFKLPYSRAKAKMFMQTGGIGPSNRAQILAETLGFDRNLWAERLTATSSPSRVTPIQPRTSSKEQTKAMANTTLTGTYKGHVLTGESSGEKGFVIKTWLNPDGNAVAQKVAKGVVGAEFKTVSAAGVAVYARMNETFGYPESVAGRHLKFSGEKAAKPAKAAKAAKAPVEDKSRKSKVENKSAPVERNSRRAGKVTVTKKGTVAAKAAPKSRKSSSKSEDIEDAEF